MTIEEERSVKAALLLEFRETDQALNVRCEKVKARAKRLYLVSYDLAQGTTTLPADADELFDLSDLRNLLREIIELKKTWATLDARVRSVGL